VSISPAVDGTVGRAFLVSVSFHGERPLVDLQLAGGFAKSSFLVMTTQDFMAQLRHVPDKLLVFVNPEGDTIHGGYHLTEIKAAKFDTVDCGGQKNRWNETILQLWVPSHEATQEFMTAGKFLSIYDRVSRMINVDPAAEVRFEYGDENFFPSNYDVESITEATAELRVELRPPQTTCKARDRRAAGATSCC
jgi:Family of unknown function (DUF6428)